MKFKKNKKYITSLKGNKKDLNWLNVYSFFLICQGVSPQLVTFSYKNKDYIKKNKHR